MKELTAMHMLIENINARLANDPPDDLMYALETVKIEAKSLLQKEQEQIEQAFDDGFVDGVDSKYGCSTKYEESKDYYQSKYGVEDETNP